MEIRDRMVKNLEHALKSARLAAVQATQAARRRRETDELSAADPHMSQRQYAQDMLKAMKAAIDSIEPRLEELW